MKISQAGPRLTFLPVKNSVQLWLGEQCCWQGSNCCCATMQLQLLLKELGLPT
jgi:hypothetical protein